MAAGTESIGRDWPSAESEPPLHQSLVVAIDLARIEPDLRLLDDHERTRAARLRSASLQHDFIAAHTALRQVLGWLVKTEPATLAFAIDAHGKPHLRGHSLPFNLSHSGGHALIAAGIQGRLGVDLECLDRLHDADRLAPRVLAPSELVAFRELPPAVRSASLLRAWTRKEAVLKALGLGLPAGMEHVIITGEPPRLSGDFTVLPELTTLCVHDLPVSSGSFAAFCQTQGHPVPLLRRWDGIRTHHDGGQLPIGGAI